MIQERKSATRLFPSISVLWSSVDSPTRQPIEGTELSAMQQTKDIHGNHIAACISKFFTQRNFIYYISSPRQIRLLSRFM